MTIPTIDKRLFRHMDRTYWVLFGFLIVVAIIALFSASSTLAYESGSVLGPVLKQMFFLAGGVILAFLLQFVPSKYIRLVGYLGLAASIICLLLTFTSLGVTRNGSTRWIKIGIEFQPSELAKLFLIIVVSDLLSRIKNPDDEKKYFFIVLALTFVVCGLILVGNLSTALLLGGVVFILFFLAHVRIKYWGTTLLIAFTLLISGYFFVEHQYIRPKREIPGIMSRASTWCGRVDDLIEELKAPKSEFRLTDENYQRSIAKVAIARGGKSPLGVLPGNSQERDYLPLAFADYIFAIIVEESGIIGALILIAIYVMILFRACFTSNRYPDYSAMLMVMGLALMITCQALVSMMVAVGIGPVTGQPLPMVTRGGTSVLITSVYFGIIMAVAREQNIRCEEQQQTTEDSYNTIPDIIVEDN